MESKNTNKKRYAFYLEPELWQALAENLEDGNRSRFIRDAIKNFVEKGDDLTELKKCLKIKEHEKELIEIEINEIKRQIVELEQIQEENINNEMFIIELIDKIKTIADNENGITEQRIKILANNKVDAKLLIGKAKSKGIKIIKESERQTDKKGNPINVKSYRRNTENKNNPYASIIKIFNRNFNTEKAKYNNSRSKYYTANKDKYIIMCNKKELDINELEKYILNLDPDGTPEN